MTLTEIQALAAEGGYPLAFSHCISATAVYVWDGPDRIFIRLPDGDFAVGFHRFSSASTDLSLDGWYPLGGFR